jgi:hypothetical protein
MADPKYVRDFKKFVRGPFRLADLSRTAAELYGSNDRAIGVIRAAAVEAALETFLRSRVRPSCDAHTLRRLF